MKVGCNGLTIKNLIFSVIYYGERQNDITVLLISINMFRESSINSLDDIKSEVNI